MANVLAGMIPAVQFLTTYFRANVRIRIFVTTLLNKKLEFASKKNTYRTTDNWTGVSATAHFATTLS